MAEAGALGEDALDMVQSGDMAMSTYAPGVMDASQYEVVRAMTQAQDLAHAEAAQRHNATAMTIADFHQAALPQMGGLSDGAAARMAAGSMGTAPDTPSADDVEAAAKAAIASAVMPQMPPPPPQDEASKAAAREAARAAARERKRKSRMNPVVREREKARDRMYKMKARQALKGDQLEAYRKKDRERKRLKRIEKAQQEAEALATGRMQGPGGDGPGMAAEVAQMEAAPGMRNGFVGHPSGHGHLKRGEGMLEAAAVASSEI